MSRTIAKLNDGILSNTDQMISEAVLTGTKWQNLTAKSINKGMPLVSRQFDITFDSLNILKNQISNGRSRLAELFERKSSVDSAQKAASDTKLTSIKGIGPKMETLLHSNGIESITDLAHSNVETIHDVLTDAGARMVNVDVTSWVNQAKELESK